MTLGFRFVCLTIIGLASAPAFAADKAPKAPECMTLEAHMAKTQEMVKAWAAVAKAEGHEAPKASLPDTFTKLSASAYHLFEGMWLEDPNTPPGLPPGDGALLGIVKGKPEFGGTLLWTTGNLVCGKALSIPKALLDAIRKVKDAPGEDKGDLL